MIITWSHEEQDKYLLTCFVSGHREDHSMFKYIIFSKSSMKNTQNKNLEGYRLCLFNTYTFVAYGALLTIRWYSIYYYISIGCQSSVILMSFITSFCPHINAMRCQVVGAIPNLKMKELGLHNLLFCGLRLTLLNRLYF